MNIIHFQSFGTISWVDGIVNYNKLVKQKPYSTNGIIAYLRIQYKDADKEFLDNIETLYKIMPQSYAWQCKHFQVSPSTLF